MLSTLVESLTLMTLVSVMMSVCRAQFMVGRLREGQYELPALNGWLTPHRARARCERDRTCGGFTYKGFISNDHSQKFKIFFFHLVLNYEDGPEVWNWVTYKAERDHIVFLNKTDPGAELLLAGKQLPLEAAKVRLAENVKHCQRDKLLSQLSCSRKRWKCVGLEERDGSAALVGSASISELKTSREGVSTWIKLELPYSGGGAGLGDRDDYDGVDRCCPPANIKQWQHFVRKYLRTKDVIPSLDCGMEPSRFVEDHVVRSEMVKVLGCETSWAARNWTIRSLLERERAGWRWRTNFVDETGLVNNTEEQGQFRLASEILEMMENNLTVRLFDDIGVHETVMRLRTGDTDQLRSDKRELRRDYSMPEIFGQDIFETCQILTDYQWTLLSGPNTGTDLHLDPAFANSWNTLLSGHKVWAVLPPDSEYELFTCDPACSDIAAEVSPLAWFQHVLPQLDGRRWYGEPVKIVLQSPGDTLFIPSRAPHAVINLDWSLGVTENVLTEEMLLDLPLSLHLGGTLSPDTTAWPGERREERLWKCVTRRAGVLDSRARRRLRGAAKQSLEKIGEKESVCGNKMTGSRAWLRDLGLDIQAEPLTVINNNNNNGNVN